MNKIVKNFVKWLVPTPLRVFEWGIGRIQADLNGSRKQIQALAADVKEERRQAQARHAEGQEYRQQQKALLEELRSKAGQAAATLKRAEEIASALEASRRYHLAVAAEEENQRKLLEEISWGQIFNSAIADSAGLKNRSFSPGRWALGFPGLYVLYRILNDIQPKRILELGLGESTKMIGQYAAFREDCGHVVVEHDPEWIAFCKAGVSKLSDRSQIIRLNLEKRVFLGDKNVTAYADFADTFKGRKFDLIVIDGPVGSGNGDYSRIDMLDLLPECLADPFVIFMDDHNRKGEQNMTAQIRLKLEGASVPYVEGKYSGQKEVAVICSPELVFLRSL